MDDLLLIRRECVWSNGAKLGGDFMCAPQVAAWLADQLELAADEEVSEVAYDSPPDHLVVFAGGGDHGAPININVLNRRAPSAPHGRTFGLTGMSPEAARKVATELRAIESRRAPESDA